MYVSFQEEGILIFFLHMSFVGSYEVKVVGCGT